MVNWREVGRGRQYALERVIGGEKNGSYNKFRESLSLISRKCFFFSLSIPPGALPTMTLPTPLYIPLNPPAL
jgi:hypothetical protein